MNATAGVIDNLTNSTKSITVFFVGDSTTYGELQKIILIFKILNADNDLGNQILEAIEADWSSREPDNPYEDGYLDGLIDGFDLLDEIDDAHRLRRRAAQEKLKESNKM